MEHLPGKFYFFLTHWSSIAEIGNDMPLPLSSPIYWNMEEFQLKRGASDAIAFLKPLGDALDRFKSDSCTIGKKCEIWRSISNETPGINMEFLDNGLSGGASCRLAGSLL